MPQPRQPGRSQPAHQALTPQPVCQVSVPQQIIPLVGFLWLEQYALFPGDLGHHVPLPQPELAGSRALAEVIGPLLIPK